MISPAVKIIHWVEVGGGVGLACSECGAAERRFREFWTVVSRDWLVSSRCSPALLSDRFLAASKSDPLEKQGLHINWGLFDHVSLLLKTKGALLSFLLAGNDSIKNIRNSNNRVQRINLCRRTKIFFFPVVMPLNTFFGLQCCQNQLKILIWKEIKQNIRRETLFLLQQLLHAKWKTLMTVKLQIYRLWSTASWWN